MKYLLAALCIMCLSSACVAEDDRSINSGNIVNDSYNQAKRMLENEVYKNHRVTLYCGAKYDKNKNITSSPDFTLPDNLDKFEKINGETTDSLKRRAKRMEWEHVVPAENFGRAFKEWREGNPKCIDTNGKPFKGRKCAEKVNKEYRYMYADMYNLYPSIGVVNALRLNYQYSQLGGENVFGSCPVKIDVTHRRFEPPNEAKGQVARASLYMADTYLKYRLSSQQRKLFEAWDKRFPVTQWECTRTKRIEKLQKNENLRVKTQCKQDGLW